MFEKCIAWIKCNIQDSNKVSIIINKNINANKTENQLGSFLKVEEKKVSNLP